MTWKCERAGCNLVAYRPSAFCDEHQPASVTPPTLTAEECEALRSHASTNGSKFTRNLLLTIADRFDPPKPAPLELWERCRDAYRKANPHGGAPDEFMWQAAADAVLKGTIQKAGLEEWLIAHQDVKPDPPNDLFEMLIKAFGLKAP